MQLMGFPLTFTVAGLCILAMFDSTMLLSLPLAVDVGVVLLSSRHPVLFWFYALLVSMCSVVGAATTYYIGRRIGQPGVQRFVPAARLMRIRTCLKHNGEVAMAALALVPPPFPFTAVVLTAGAFGLSAPRFLAAIFGFRLVRFGSEAALAAFYGTQIVDWMRSTFFSDIAHFFTAVAIGASIVTVVQFFVNSHGPRIGDRLWQKGRP
jgi:membrane protein YqaA with SNARE-associated domain